MVQFYLATQGTQGYLLNKYIDTSSEPGFPKTIVNLQNPNSEQIVGIDIRPFDNVLYALTNDSGIGRLYTIEPEAFVSSAPATFIGVIRNILTAIELIGTNFGFDFDPTNDRIRIVSSSSQNLTTNPVTALTLEEFPINFAGPGNASVLASAYTNNLPPPVATTMLYDIGTIDSGSPTLFTQNPANLGTLTQVGPVTGFVGTIAVGFDIQTNNVGDNEAFAVIETAVPGFFSTDLYSIDLVTGQGTFLGNLLADQLSSLGGFTLIKQGRIPCLHPHTLVQTSDDSSVRIETLKGGDIVIDYKGQKVEIIKNARFDSTDTFYKIKKNALSLNVPLNDVLIRGEHPILYKGRHINAKRLQGKLGKEWIEKVKLNEKVPVWSLCTKERTFVMMEGIKVCTWQYDDLLKNREFRRRFY